MKIWWRLAALLIVLSSCGGLFVCGAFAALPTTNTWLANCNTGVITELVNNEVISQGSGYTASTALGAVIAISQPSGTTIAISGICTEDITLTTSGITITNDNNSSAPATTDGIEGQLEILGAQRTTIKFLTLGWPAAGNSLRSGDVANVYIHGGASVQIENGAITNGPLVGVLTEGNSSVELDNSTIFGNARTGLKMLRGASATVIASTIENNGGYQAYFFGSSTGFFTSASMICTGTISGSGCTPASSGEPTIAVLGASSVQIDGGGGRSVVTGPNNAQALVIGGASLALIQGSTFAAAGSTLPVIEVTSASAINSPGGNTVCVGTWTTFCQPTPGGLAVQVDHVANLLQVPAGPTGYPASEDFIFGGGLIQQQSNADFGTGPSSLHWTVGTANLQVQQNSSLRLTGGVTIVGNLILEQGSNGFFNTSNGGGQNNVSSVTCLFSTAPVSRISGSTAYHLP